MPRPTYRYEREHGPFTAGVDEAGRGPWAGPVVAAAVILNPKKAPSGIKDSKRLTREERGDLYALLMERALCAVGSASVEEIDYHNILGATKLAMQRAVAGLPQAPVAVLIDGNQPPKFDCRTIAIIGGDGISMSIAAASIIAKVTRDRLMAELHEAHPHYGFDRHVGYGTQAHQRALAEHGPCAIHRKSFAPIRALLDAAAA